MSETPTPQPANNGGGPLRDFAARFTQGFTRVVDRLMDPLLDPPAPEERRGAADNGPEDWDPDMPYQPDSPGLYMLLQDVVLIRRREDRESLHIEMTAYPQTGYLSGQTYTAGMSVALDMTLSEDTPAEEAQEWFDRLDLWAMTETPLVLMGRDGDVAVLVNADAPGEWLPLPIT